MSSKKDKLSSHRINKLVLGFLAVEAQSAQEAKSLAYMARAMVLATLPHSKPEGHIFQRQNGDVTVMMVGNPKFGLPYGSLPRLILAWITREVKKTNATPTINLGKTYSEFLNVLGLSQSGGSRGDATRLRDQMIKLFSTHVSCVYHNKTQGVCKADNFSITRSFELWWNPIKEDDNRFSTGSVVTLAKDFFDELRNRPVPVDFRALKAFSRSPLQIDIYIWLTYRFSYLKKSTFIPWKMLSDQFGASYECIRGFKRGFLNALRTVTALYHDAKVNVEDDGIVLKPSPTHVKPRSNQEGK